MWYHNTACKDAMRVCANPFRHSHKATLCGCGEIGIRIRFRILRREACRFDPCHPHQRQRAPRSGCPLSLVWMRWRTTRASQAREKGKRKEARGKVGDLRGSAAQRQADLPRSPKARETTPVTRTKDKGHPEGVPSIKQVLPTEKKQKEYGRLFVLLFTRLACKV